MPGHPLDQSAYQVRLEWGAAGLARLAPADVVVIVDVLSFSESIDADLTDAAAGTGAVVMLGALRNASAVARAVYAEQQRRGTRTSVAIIAAGEPAEPGAGIRFAVEDQLGAGAIVDALGALGIDHTSPDAAVAGELFRALRRAVTHLLTASGSGRALIDAGRRDEVVAAATVDAASVVPTFRAGEFRPL